MVPVLRPTALWLLLGIAVVAGCPHRRGGEEDLRAALAAADVAWRDRGTGGYGPVEDALALAESIVPGDPEVGWRRVRLGIARGIETDDPVVALRAFAGARDVGMSCARGPTVGVSAVNVTVALRAVDDTRAPCVDWTALAWARWLEVFGPDAAAIDLPRIDALLAWSSARPPLAGPHAGVALWAEGILAAVRPAGQGRDLDLARARLLGVMEQSSDDAVVLLDLLRLVAEPSGDRALAQEIAASLQEVDLESPEERGAVGRWRITTPGLP